MSDGSLEEEQESTDLEALELLRLLYSGRAVCGDWGGLGVGGHDELDGLVSVLIEDERG